MNKEEQIITEAKYIIEHKLAISKAAKELNVNRKTLAIHMNDRLSYISPNLYSKIKELFADNKNKLEKQVPYEVVLEEANFIVSNGATLEETARYFAISPRTLQNHFKKYLKEKNPYLYGQVLEVFNGHMEKGRIVGGQVGLKASSYSKSEVKDMAIYMLAHNMTYRQAEVYFNIPRSTISELFLNLIDDKEILLDLSCLAEANKKFILSSKISEKYMAMIDPNYTISFENTRKK